MKKILIAGIDESGRGPLAGPVFAAVVILNPKNPIDGLADSKLLSAKERERLFEEITNKCLAFGIGRADVIEIDTLNILQASLLAMQRAVAELAIVPQRVLVDGNRCPQLPYPSQAIIKGDQLVPAISAASIVAKVSRDREMKKLDSHYPGYGFARHKGYCTEFHLERLQQLGACAIHRQSFEPVRKRIEESK